MHDQARSRAYHWGENGLAGISDHQQRLCFAVGLWNGRDPILNERPLTNSEGNHSEDVKEYYFYLDSTPTHSYMEWQLIVTVRSRHRRQAATKETHTPLTVQIPFIQTRSTEQAFRIAPTKSQLT